MYVIRCRVDRMHRAIQTNETYHFQRTITFPRAHQANTRNRTYYWLFGVQSEKQRNEYFTSSIDKVHKKSRCFMFAIQFRKRLPSTAHYNKNHHFFLLLLFLCVIINTNAVYANILAWSTIWCRRLK